MNEKELLDVYISRPFKIRNADEYELESILDLFIDPTDGLTGPFDFANSIIKGKMGSGKTMYLRANYAYYLHTLVPCLIDDTPIVLPVYIKLSDFQNIKSPEQIYQAILIKIIEEIAGVCKHLQSSEELARLHTGALTLNGIWATEDIYLKITEKLKTLSASEYVQKVSESFDLSGSATAKFLSTHTNYGKNVVKEMKINTSVTFQDVIDACNQLVTAFNGKLLILFDEVGSINKSFFKGTRSNASYFEIMMNQLRTLPFVRTKIAVYPHSYSDILTETRYGDSIELECDFENNNLLYTSFIEKTVSLIERYIEKASNYRLKAEDIFDVAFDDQQLVIQLINASKGNMRRLVHLLDMSMNEAFNRSQGKERVTLNDVMQSLRRQGEMMESKYTNKEKTFLSTIVDICKKRSTYKFSYPNKSNVLNKYISLSEEYNILNIQSVGSGRQSHVYSFDYAYCIYRELPTHYLRDSERIDKTRNSVTGEPIQRVAQLSDELFSQSNIRGKIEAQIIMVVNDSLASAQSDNGTIYLVLREYVINTDQKKKFHIGGKLSFVPSKVNNVLFASDIEVLD